VANPRSGRPLSLYLNLSMPYKPFFYFSIYFFKEDFDFLFIYCCVDGPKSEHVGQHITP